MSLGNHSLAAVLIVTSFGLILGACSGEPERQSLAPSSGAGGSALNGGVSGSGGALGGAAGASGPSGGSGCVLAGSSAGGGGAGGANGGAGGVSAVTRSGSGR